MVIRLEDRIEGRGEVKGTLFTKEFENDRGYVYKADSGGKPYFEAFYKKSHPVCIDFEQRIYSETEEKEVYPKAKDFGLWAWTCGSLEKAINKIKPTNDE